MGISFKVSETGKRFRHNPVPSNAAVLNAEDDELNDAPIATSKPEIAATLLSARKLGEARENRGITKIGENEVSFTLKLFPDGYSIGKPENEPGNQTSIDVPKFLHPYDRASEALFSAIESGRLPGDILDDIPCRYIDGTLVCEVRDYRKCFAEGVNVASGESSPAINRVSLKMSLENIVKDIPAISENNWTYGDLMEVESRILKAVQPQLCLDPTPQLDRLSKDPVQNKLNLDLRSMRRKRLRQISEVAVSNNNHVKRVTLDRVPENSRLGDIGSIMQQSVYENMNNQNNVSSAMLQLRSNSFGSDGSLLPSPMSSHQPKYYGSGSGSPRMMKDQRSGALLSATVGSPGGQDMMIPFADNAVASLHGKRENQDVQSSVMTNKKARLMHTGAEGNMQHLGPQMDALHGSELHWKNTLMQQQQPIGRGIQYANNGMQKFPQQVFEGGLNQEGGTMPFTVGQQGMRYMKEEPFDTDRLDKSESQIPELSNIDSQQSRMQQRVPHQMMRSGFPQSPWNNLVQPLDNSSRKEDPFQKRKLVQSPHVSGGGLPQSPLSSKSGEFSSGSMGQQLGAAVTSGLVSSQKDKHAVSSVPSVGIGGNQTFSANDSVQRQNQAHAAAKRRSNSLPKTSAISGVGSPASVGNMMQINISSPPVGTQSLGDQTTLERFSKLEMVTTRFQLNCKKSKVDEYPIRKPNAYSAQQMISHLSNDSNSENFKDDSCKMPLSKSLVGGNMNVCKIRIQNFIQTERILQGNTYQVVSKGRTRMIMSEKPNDGSVAIHIGDIEDSEYLAAEDYLPTLPNTHMADLLAAQYASLMIKEGYHMEDHVQPKPVRMIPCAGSMPNAPGNPPTNAAPEMQQFSEGVSLQQQNDVKPSNSGNATSSQNVQGSRMLPPGNTQSIQMSQGLLSVSSRPQQPEQLQPMQQQHAQFQRSQMMLPTNSIQHLNNIAQSNMQLGPHMTNKTSALQLQLLQQQQQQQSQLLQPQQQQQNMQRRMMPGMGNIGNNMVGLGGLGNVMGIGGSRGVGGSGISAPMGSMSNIGNLNQNAMNLSSTNFTNAIRSGTLTPPQHAAYMKMRMASQNRSNMLGNPQSSIGSIPGARQMHPGSGLSMLGPALTRANMNLMQRTAMGPPKIPGMNLYMNQQQQQLQQQQQQLQLQQQQQQLQQQLQQQQLQQQQQPQQQETTSPLQAVVSPPQVGSPSSVGIPHQMNQQQQQQASPQQMSQKTPMSPQLSSGAIHSMAAGNHEACPASPQLSSQTMGSVGSIANSPMELQGVNTSNSVNNAQ